MQRKIRLLNAIMLPVFIFILFYIVKTINRGEMRSFKAEVEHSSHIPGIKPGGNCF